ncbi:MAG: hypothetical protein MZU97_03590 [Bacillus subtilis]|nr:hypothetical protein [Bacillus subtilis]
MINEVMTTDLKHFQIHDGFIAIQRESTGYTTIQKYKYVTPRVLQCVSFAGQYLGNITQKTIHNYNIYRDKDGLYYDLGYLLPRYLLGIQLIISKKYPSLAKGTFLFRTKIEAKEVRK